MKIKKNNCHHKKETRVKKHTLRHLKIIINNKDNKQILNVRVECARLKLIQSVAAAVSLNNNNNRYSLTSLWAFLSSLFPLSFYSARLFNPPLSFSQPHRARQHFSSLAPPISYSATQRASLLSMYVLLSWVWLSPHLCAHSSLNRHTCHFFFSSVRFLFCFFQFVPLFLVFSTPQPYHNARWCWWDNVNWLWWKIEKMIFLPDEWVLFAT